MIAWVFQITVGSFLFIFLVHHLITFLKSTLTIPKIKDLVDSPSEKYKHIYAELNNSHTPKQVPIPVKQESSMKQDLKSFLKKQLNINKSDLATDLQSLDSNYSPYVV